MAVDGVVTRLSFGGATAPSPIAKAVRSSVEESFEAEEELGYSEEEEEEEEPVELEEEVAEQPEEQPEEVAEQLEEVEEEVEQPAEHTPQLEQPQQVEDEEEEEEEQPQEQQEQPQPVTMATPTRPAAPHTPQTPHTPSGMDDSMEEDMSDLDNSANMSTISSFSVRKSDRLDDETHRLLSRESLLPAGAASPAPLLPAQQSVSRLTKSLEEYNARLVHLQEMLSVEGDLDEDQKRECRQEVLVLRTDLELIERLQHTAELELEAKDARLRTVTVELESAQRQLALAKQEIIQYKQRLSALQGQVDAVTADMRQLRAEMSSRKAAPSRKTRPLHIIMYLQLLLLLSYLVIDQMAYMGASEDLEQYYS